jgi:hypothetical protein
VPVAMGQRQPAVIADDRRVYGVQCSDSPLVELAGDSSNSGKHLRPSGCASEMLRSIAGIGSLNKDCE